MGNRKTRVVVVEARLLEWAVWAAEEQLVLKCFKLGAIISVLPGPVDSCLDR